jgi:PAS domain S-box-containing protein
LAAHQEIQSMLNSADVPVSMEQEISFRMLVESVAEYAIFMLDPEGHVLTWNEGAKRIKGYSSEEIIGRHFSHFYTPEARDSGWPQRELEIAAEQGRFTDEGWRVRKDGTKFWAVVVITALRDKTGTLYGFSKVTRDMTDRRDWEERVQKLNTELRSRLNQLTESQKLVELRTLELQNLSGRLLQLQDEERRRIARELHDSVGQELAALKMTLGVARTNEEREAAIKESIALTESAIKSVRSLSYLLHPPLLDESGLLPALHWFIDGVRKRSGIQVQLDIKPVSFPRLGKDTETTIFRVIQEALTNVYRHSGSTGARVELDRQPERVVLRIRDYGKGMLPNPSSMGSGSIGVGIGGMRERVKQFGGELTLSSAEPGTIVEAFIPLFPPA